jgi:hypothetical protein
MLIRIGLINRYHQKCAAYAGTYLIQSVIAEELVAHSGGWSPNWVLSAPRRFTVLLCLPCVIVRMENYSVE